MLSTFPKIETGLFTWSLLTWSFILTSRIRSGSTLLHPRLFCLVGGGNKDFGAATETEVYLCYLVQPNGQINEKTQCFLPKKSCNPFYSYYKLSPEGGIKAK